MYFISNQKDTLITLPLTKLNFFEYQQYPIFRAALSVLCIIIISLSTSLPFLHSCTPECLECERCHRDQNGSWVLQTTHQNHASEAGTWLDVPSA